MRGAVAKRAMGSRRKPWKSARGKAKIQKTMDEWKSGSLHSGSKKGPHVTNRKQAIAIALNQARRAGA